MLQRTTKIAALCTGVLVSSMWAQESARRELFPIPHVIRPNVEFWKKVYAVYRTNQVLIHDIDNLSIIYEVVDIDQWGEDLSYRLKWRKINKIKDEYSHILNQLARGRLDVSDPNPRVTRVIEIFGGQANSSVLKKAARSVRAQLGLKNRFRDGLQRSGLYLDFIKDVLNENNLPAELVVLPHVESSFNHKAYSKVGAAGMWQFTRSTGRLFMKINYDIDERLDPLRSTEAAAKLLKLNYSELGSWPLAITAYNHGLHGMKRAKKKFGADFGQIYQHYRSRSFGFASKNFYAEFIAALEVVENYKKYFGEVELHRPADFVEIELDHYVKVNDLVKAYEIETEELTLLNPALRPPVLNSRRRIPKGYKLRLPATLGLDASLLADRISPTAKHTEQVKSDWYKVRRGDNLNSIARRFSISIESIEEHNDIDRREILRTGTVLRIPSPGTSFASVSKLPKPKPESQSPITIAKATPPPPKAERQRVTESIPTRVVPASSAGIDVAGLNAEEEPMSREEREAIITYDLEPEVAPILEGKLASLGGAVKTDIHVVPNEEPQVVSEWIIVGPEETLGHYANWLGVPTQRLRNLNGLRFNQEIQIGQRIRLDYSRVNYVEFERRRNEFLRSIEEDFFSTYVVDALQTHQVKRGENIWQISNIIYEVPIWLVAKYNPDRDLSKLNPGDELFVPTIVTINPETAPSVQEE